MLLASKPKNRIVSKRYPAGKTRFVCVNRSAIAANMKDNKNYPSVLVVEDGVVSEFHAADVNGNLKYEDRTDLPAKVFVETTEEVVAYTDPEGEQKFLNTPRAYRIRAALTRINNATLQSHR